jgi:hypothetical protein
MGSIPATPSTEHASCFPPSSLPASIEISIKLVVCLYRSAVSAFRFTDVRLCQRPGPARSCRSDGARQQRAQRRQQGIAVPDGRRRRRRPRRRRRRPRRRRRRHRLQPLCGRPIQVVQHERGKQRARQPPQAAAVYLLRILRAASQAALATTPAALSASMTAHFASPVAAAAACATLAAAAGAAAQHAVVAAASWPARAVARPGPHRRRLSFGRMRARRRVMPSCRVLATAPVVTRPGRGCSYCGDGSRRRPRRLRERRQQQQCGQARRRRQGARRWQRRCWRRRRSSLKSAWRRRRAERDRPLGPLIPLAQSL